MTRTLTTEQLSQIKADIASRKAMPEFGKSIEGNIERLRVIGATRSHFSTETFEMLVQALEEKSRALADAERERDDWIEHSRKMEHRAIEAEEKLANREAQPVAATPIYQIWDDDGWCDTSEQIWRETYDDFRKEQYRIVYTAPPAPAVPEEMTGGIAMSKYKVKKSNYAQWVKGWNACRAAMLAQPASSGYKLPDNVREALTLALQAMEFMGDTLNNIDAVCTEDVEYVTPAFNAVRKLLAAAPEGGNDHDTRR